MKKPCGTLEDRFWKKVRKTSKCWEWTASKLTHGYGQMGLGGRKDGHDVAHRISWKLHYGEIPGRLQVLHKCDNRGCVRPDHLFLGTPLDNILDMCAKGRWNGPMGERHLNAKLNPEKVKAIRDLIRDGLNCNQIAKRYSVNSQTIYQIKNGSTWKHVK